MSAKRWGFAVSLRVFRELLGLSREQFGARIDVAHRTIGRWENGDHEPEGERRARLARLVVDLGPGAGLGRAEMVDLLGTELAHLAEKGAAGRRAAVPKHDKTPKPRASVLKAADAIDAAVLQVADELDVGPRTLRAGLGKVLAVAMEQRVSQNELARLLEAGAKGRKRRSK